MAQTERNTVSDSIRVVSDCGCLLVGRLHRGNSGCATARTAEELVATESLITSTMVG